MYEINFEFQNILWPGLYFIGFGISDTKKAGYFLARRIDEAIRIMDDNKINIGQVSMKRDS